MARKTCKRTMGFPCGGGWPKEKQHAAAKAYRWLGELSGVGGAQKKGGKIGEMGQLVELLGLSTGVDVDEKRKKGERSRDGRAREKEKRRKREKKKKKQRRENKEENKMNKKLFFELIQCEKIVRVIV